MQFLEFSFGSAWYRQMQDLRQEVLRKPLGLDLHAADLSVEAGYRHFGLEMEGCLVACLMAVPLNGGVVQLRQMAVDPAWQGRGLGRQLMGEVERILQADGICHFVLNARLSALRFYQKLGYWPVGDVFAEVNIDHQRMEKAL